MSRQAKLKRRRARQRRLLEQKRAQIASRKISTAQLFEALEQQLHILRNAIIDSEKS